MRKRVWRGLNARGFVPDKPHVVLASSLRALGCPDCTQPACRGAASTADVQL